MIRYRVVVPPELRDTFIHLAPTIKRKLHAGLRLLETEPLAGKALERELTGYRSYQIHPYRIVYRLEAALRVVRVVVVAPRPVVYELLSQRLHSQTGSVGGGFTIMDRRRRRRWLIRRRV